MLIGLAGKKQSGKSTVTSHLKKKHNFKEVLWAYPIKEIVGKQLFGLTDEMLYGDKQSIREMIIPEWGKSAREILQLVGTEWFRKQIHPDFWVKFGLRKIKELNSNVNHIVVSDCRFPNELNAIKAHGGWSIRIIREGQVSTDTHESETALDNYLTDFTITAPDGDLDYLYHKMDKLVKQLKKQRTRFAV